MHKVQHVHRREDADLTPGHKNRIRRLKYSTVAEILIEYRAANAIIGRSVCHVCDYMEQHLSDPVMAVEQHVYSHPEWGPQVLCETIRNTPWFNNPDSHPHGQLIAEAVQHDAALALVEYHPWNDNSRNATQELLKHHATKFHSMEALYVILAFFNAGHPNPRMYLEKPEVAPKLPADLPVHLFPAPDFEHLRKIVGVG